jgi:hypothetical protein
VGAVVFTGHDTKVLQNGTAPPSKRSSLEKQMDKIIIALFLALFIMAFVTGLVYGETQTGASWACQVCCDLLPVGKAHCANVELTACWVRRLNVMLTLVLKSCSKLCRGRLLPRARAALVLQVDSSTQTTSSASACEDSGRQPGSPAARPPFIQSWKARSFHSAGRLLLFATWPPLPPRGPSPCPAHCSLPLLAGLLTKHAMPAAWYLAPSQPEVYWDPGRAAVGGILQFITGLVLYGYLIPISLYVTVEIVKVLQAFNISQVRGPRAAVVGRGSAAGLLPLELTFCYDVMPLSGPSSCAVGECLRRGLTLMRPAYILLVALPRRTFFSVLVMKQLGRARIDDDSYTKFPPFLCGSDPSPQRTLVFACRTSTCTMQRRTSPPTAGRPT